MLICWILGVLDCVFFDVDIVGVVVVVVAVVVGHSTRWIFLCTLIIRPPHAYKPISKVPTNSKTRFNTPKRII